MHTREFEYTEDDKRYSEYRHDVPKAIPDKVYFHFNSDLSGEIHINNGIEEVKVPGWMLIDFVGGHIADEMIGRLEQMDGKQVLEFLAGVEGSNTNG